MEAAKWTTDNPAWEHAYVDRAKQLVFRDQLHPSVIIWSLGNEAFFGRNFKSMYSWIKSYDDSRPIHYEADIYAETMDMYSTMYPPIETIVDFAQDDSKTKPLVLCEFIHAMGNGPGNIKEYIDAFYEYPKLQGGFVWEWANHGLLTTDKETGDEFYAYGGDFGDVPNDSNFIMDGVLHSDHTPTPGLIEYKKGLEPVKVVAYDPGKATIVNRYDFITLDHLECSYVVLDEGKPTSQSGNLEIPPGIEPGRTADLTLPSTDFRGEGILQLSFHQLSATPSLSAGFEVAFAEIPLRPSSAPYPLLPPSFPPATDTKLSVTETPTLLTITTSSSTANTTWTFSPIHGKLLSWTRNSTAILATTADSGPEFSAFRARTDNDVPQDGRDWCERLLHLAKVYTRSCTWDAVEAGERTFTIHAHQRFAPPVLSWAIDLHLTYTFHASGALSLRAQGSPRGQNLPRTLPRIGLSFEMPGSWAGGDPSLPAAAVAWYGRGPGESYADKKLSQRAGVHEARSVAELWTGYEVPQEGGNRTDTRWVRFAHAGGEALTVQFVDLSGKRTLFDFAASHYRAKDVEAARHPHELRRRRTENVVVRLDRRHHGLGSGSCGPRTRDEYALLAEDFEFEVLFS